MQDGHRRFPRLIIAAVADGCRGIRVAVHKVRASEFEIVADVVRRFGRLQLDGLGRHGRGLCLPPAAAAPEHLAVEIIRSRAERRAALYRRRRDDGHIEHQGKILIRRVERDRQGAVVIRRDGQHMRQPAGIERALLRRAQRGGGVLRRQRRSVGKAHAGNKGIAIGLSVLRGREALTEQRLGAEMRRNDEQALIQQRKRRAVHRRRAGIGVEAVLRQVGQAERLRRGGSLRRGGRSLLRRLLRGLRGLTGRRAGAQQQSKQQAEGKQSLHISPPPAAG